MSYVTSTLMPGESIVARTNFHWVIFRWSIALVIAAIVVFVAAFSAGDNRGLVVILSFVLFGAAVVAAVPPFFKRWTTEICATNKRVIYKTGFFQRHTTEMPLANIQTIDVDQSILGRIFDYGALHCFAGDKEERIKMVAHPLGFRSAITAQ